MSLKSANNLENCGRIQDSLGENFRILEHNPTGGLAGIAELNILRLCGKLSDAERKEAKSKLKKIKTRNTIHTESNPNDERIFVSVIVPCYNCQDFLEHTVNSLKNQTYSNFEVILVDDFSSDLTSTICKKTAKQDKRFRFYQHRANGGLAAARNSGTRLAKGDYICYLDSDDLLAKESLAQRVEMLSKYSLFESVAGVYESSITIPHDFDGEIEAKDVKTTKHFVDFISSYGDCPFNANQPMLRKDVVISMGGFPEQYPQAEDWRLWSKILRSGYIFLPVNRVGSGYRQTLNSMIRRAPLTHIEKSKGNFFRAFSTTDGEWDPAEIRYENNYYAKALFTDSVGIYAGKQKFLSRIFNFIGIEFGRVETFDGGLDARKIAEYILKVEPDFDLVFSGYSIGNVFNWICNGYKRYYGTSHIDKVKSQEIEKFTEQTLNYLRPSWDFIQPPGTAVIVPDRMIPRNDVELIDILFMPHKYYHTYSFSLLLDELDKRGLSYRFLDISVPYRNEGAKTNELEAFFLSYNEFVFSRLAPRLIVCMNDWDTVIKPVVRMANAEGIPTVGIVEGVQDYLDVDTGRKRNPYKEVSSVFLTGEFDRRYFEGSNQILCAIGIQRLEGLGNFRKARADLFSSGEPHPFVVLNVNFSYGVMTDRRAQWIADVSAACEFLGLDLVISQHPQDDADLSAYNVSEEPLYELLTKAKFFISRFSGAILEALVIGCPVIYYNGHGEKTDKFYDPMGAYEVANNKDEMIAALKKEIDHERNIDSFLGAHSCYGAGSIVDRTVNALERIVLDAPQDIEKYTRFKRSLVA